LLVAQKKAKKKIQFALVFFTSSDNLNLEQYKLKEDPYFVYWLANLMIVYDSDMAAKFWQANDWLKQYLPNWLEPKISRRMRVLPKTKKICYTIIRLVLANFEKIFKQIQLRILTTPLQEMKNLDTRVVINDKVLKMHVQDRREEYLEKYKHCLIKYEIT
jgi:hypothetical protein